MHRVTQERTHRKCEWKHGEGHGVVTLDRKEPPRRRLDKQCLLMEVRLTSVLGNHILCEVRSLLPKRFAKQEKVEKKDAYDLKNCCEFIAGR